MTKTLTKQEEHADLYVHVRHDFGTYAVVIKTTTSEIEVTHGTEEHCDRVAEILVETIGKIVKEYRQASA